MSLEDFIKRKIVRRASKDEGLIKSLIKTSDEDLEVIQDLNLTELSAREVMSRKVISSYYGIFRAVLEALAPDNGYKVYSHEAITAFLGFLGEKKMAEKFGWFRKIRNKINYYGKDISVEEVRERLKEIKI